VDLLLALAFTAVFVYCGAVAVYCMRELRRRRRTG